MNRVDMLNTPLKAGDTVIISSKSKNKSYLTIGIIVVFGGKACTIKTFKNNLYNKRIGTQTMLSNSEGKFKHLIKFNVYYDDLTDEELLRIDTIQKQYFKNKKD